MAINLLDLIKGQVGQEIISKIAGSLGETESNTTKVLDSAIPTLISGLMNQSSTSNGASTVFNLLGEQKNDGKIFSNILSLISNDKSTLLSTGTKLVSRIFGDKTNGIIDLLASFTGVKKETSSSIMAMAAPLVLDAIGQQKDKLDLDTNGITSLLMNQKDYIKNYLPVGINSALGISSLDAVVETAKDNISKTVSNTVSHTTSTVKNIARDTRQTVNNTYENTTENSGGIMRWLLPLLLLLLLLGLLAMLVNKCNKGNGGTTGGQVTDTTATHSNSHGHKHTAGDGHNHGTDSATHANTNNNAATNVPVTLPKATVDTVTGAVTYDLGTIMTKKLPNGTEIKYPTNGSEAALINFIEKGNIDTVDKSKGWINLYDVQFVKGTEYRKGAAEQIANIVNVLKAYPNVQIKLGGYTDNTGAIEANNKISQQRADKVKAEMDKSGVSKQITKAEGYGPQHPVADNNTAEGRAQNRRVSIRVVGK